MTTPRVRRDLRGALAAVTAAVTAVLALLALAVHPGLAASGVTFGVAKATSTYDQSIDLQQPATLPDGVTNVDAEVTLEGSKQTQLFPVQPPAAGSTTLRYSYATPAGSLAPNTVLQLGFRVRLSDGTVAESPTTTVRYEDTRFQWKTLSGSLVKVHWSEGDDAFGRRALQIAERGVSNAEELLGVTETQPIDFFIYADRNAFFEALGNSLPETTGGLARTDIRTLFANIAPSGLDDAWVGIVIPHELTHLVFATAIDNPYHEPPHWLNEGLAVYLSEGYDASARSDVESAARAGRLMPLHAIAGQFPSPPDLFGQAYDEAVSAIDFIVRTHGRDSLVKLIRSYGDGVSDDQAFTSALGLDLNGFEAAWFADLDVAEPSPFGPRAAPAGQRPPGWGSPAPGAPTDSPDLATPPPASSLGSDDTLASAGLGLVLGLAIVAVLGLIMWQRRPRPIVVPPGTAATIEDRPPSDAAHPAEPAAPDPGATPGSPPPEEPTP